MNHLQLLTLTASFKLKWPSNVDDLLSSSKPAAEVSTQIISFDWFLDQRQNGGSNIIRLYSTQRQKWNKIIIITKNKIKYSPYGLEPRRSFQTNAARIIYFLLLPR